MEAIGKDVKERALRCEYVCCKDNWTDGEKIVRTINKNTEKNKKAKMDKLENSNVTVKKTEKSCN